MNPDNNMKIGSAHKNKPRRPMKMMTSPFNEGMTPPEIMEGLRQKNLMLSQKNDEYLELIEKRAQAERAYNIAVAEATLRLKSEGMPATLISTLVKGDKIVAKLKMEFDVAEGVERACLNVIKNLRSAIDTYRSLLAWLKAEMTTQ